MTVKLIFATIGLFISILFYWYLLRPSPPFPGSPYDSTQSREPADLESELRRGYFTDFTREQVIAHYSAQFDFLPMVRLNYPPEEAQFLIRDQTRSTFLEELTHPFRESLYINGFRPKEGAGLTAFDGRLYAQKIIIRQVNSGVVERLLFGTFALILSFILAREWYLLIWKSQ